MKFCLKPIVDFEPNLKSVEIIKGFTQKKLKKKKKIKVTIDKSV